MNNNQKAILGFVVGVAAGAIAGIFLAPSSGDETRKKLAEKTKGYTDDLGNQITSAVDKLSAFVKEATKEGRQMAHNLEGKAKMEYNNMEEKAKKEFNVN